jgi:tRNA U34 5-methylaminomethyl-2-thiouridine-forming methyltransferase MnmC
MRLLIVLETPKNNHRFYLWDMKREIIATGDGSHSVFVREMNTSYHSRYGAIQESQHVFMEAGLLPLLHQQPILQIFEMGFGTGLNALLTLVHAESSRQPVYYRAIEKYPLPLSMTSRLNYCQLLGRLDLLAQFNQMHESGWQQDIRISKNFRLWKWKQDFTEYIPDPGFHLIFYDAFDPVAQPELWQKKIFEKLFDLLLPGGRLLTYSSNGRVRRALEAAGLKVQKLPGPPHKREIIRASKKESAI